VAKVGYVGLGVMGGGVARRLLEAGHEVTGYNRTRSKAEALIASGMRFADTASDAAAQSEVVFSMVTNTEALAAVTEGPDGILAGLGPGKVYVDMSTVSPGASRGLAERVAERGAAMLDARCRAA
jgi:3-hydroxyisobutyrate dehydrogenase-like beta-hydroxyacid dehydrogenase